MVVLRWDAVAQVLIDSVDYRVHTQSMQGEPKFSEAGLGGTIFWTVALMACRTRTATCRFLDKT